MAFDPITSVVLGVTLLEESLHSTAGGYVATLAALAGALAGMAILARTQSETTTTKPLSAPATA
jgi:predicted anti-sigma-YlaC factor YlaD